MMNDNGSTVLAGSTFTGPAASSASATDLFEEIVPLSKQGTSESSLWVQVIVSKVEPRQCGPLVKDLSRLQREEDRERLAHLRRVHRIEEPIAETTNVNDGGPTNGSSPPAKKPKTNEKDNGERNDEHETNTKATKRKRKQKQKGKRGGPITLRILLGFDNDDTRQWLQDHGLIEKYGLDPVSTVVPGRSANTQEELEQWNHSWPTHYFPNQQKKGLDETEIAQMVYGMQQAIADGHQNQFSYGAVMMDPRTSKVVSTSHDEYMAQTCLDSQGRLLKSNPLVSPVLLCIQGVCRLERAAAAKQGMDSPDFQGGQYICTG